MASGELADHLGDVGAIERAERDDAVVGASSMTGGTRASQSR
jgi:hypothetical protein